MKMGLDDYLCSHNAEELTNLPILEVKERTKRVSQAEKILTLAKDIELFHDQNNDGFAFIGAECLLLRSKKVRQYLARLLYRSEGSAPNNEALSQALNVLEAKAGFDGPQKKLYNRVARIDDAFFYDLADEGKAVKITKEGWTIEQAPILFRRYSHQQPQVIPKKGGDPWQVLDFLNVSKENELLILIYTVSCFVPDIAHPIFHPHGAQGSGKTCLFKIIKRLCDPSSIETIITPKDRPELVQVLAHHYICLFDNVSGLSDWMSDILAQACTGGAFTKRMLFTDDDDVNYNLRRCIGLNGTGTIVVKPDLLDRTILIQLERIEADKRKEERELWERFEKVKPEILGGIFDTLALAMKIFPSAKPHSLPRMADFSRWGFAIAEAFGINGENFLRAYQKNIEKQNEEVVQGNTLMQAVLNFMEDINEWEGTVSEAYDLLCNQIKLSRDDSTFPKHANKLRKHLNRIKANLLDFGIQFAISDYHAKEGVPLSFHKVAKGCSLSSPSTPEAKKHYDINKISFKAEVEDAVKMEEDAKVSSPGYTQHNLLKTQENEDGEHGEDKKPCLSESHRLTKSEVIEVLEVLE
ncbi:MAG: hypothetical protein V2A69_11485 [Pseudomonadota bacterium]